MTTPQLLAQEVASRAAEMARQTGMQLLGVIENMTSEVFGSGGGERLAAELGVHAARQRSARRAPPRGRRRGHAARPLGPDCEPARAIFEIARAIDASRSAGFTRTLPLVS